jgi:hypothetical protein
VQPPACLAHLHGLQHSLQAVRVALQGLKFDTAAAAAAAAATAATAEQTECEFEGVMLAGSETSMGSSTVFRRSGSLC